jgi:hypothetical protein
VNARCLWTVKTPDGRELGLVAALDVTAAERCARQHFGADVEVRPARARRTPRDATLLGQSIDERAELPRLPLGIRF